MFISKVKPSKDVKTLYGKLEREDQAKVDDLVEQGNLLIRDIIQRAREQIAKVQEDTAKDMRKVAVVSKQKVEKLAKSIHADISVTASKWHDEYEGNLETPKGLCIEGDIHVREYFGDSMAEVWYQIYQDLKQISPCDPDCHCQEIEDSDEEA